MERTAPLFQLDRVRFGYEALVAIDDVSMAIERGKRIALLGANGSGKSTLLRLLDALFFPDSGSISFHGERLDRERFDDDRFAFHFRRRVGMVFQDPDVQLFNPTVFDEVAFAPLQLHWPKHEIVESVGRVLDSMEISISGPAATPALRRGEEASCAGVGAGARPGSAPA